MPTVLLPRVDHRGTTASIQFSFRSFVVDSSRNSTLLCRTDSLESSSSSSRGYPIMYKQTVPPLRVDSVDEGDFDEDEDEEDEDDFDPPLSRGPSSPIRSPHFGSRRYSGPYDQPSYQSQPRSPVSSRHSYGCPPSSYGPPPLRTSYYDTPPAYISATLHDHHIYGLVHYCDSASLIYVDTPQLSRKTSNARGSIGGEDPDDDY